MTELSTLVQDLKSRTNGSELSRDEIGGLIDGRVALPDDFRDGEAKIGNMNYGSKGPSPLYHLLVSAFPGRTIDEVQPILDEMLRRAKGLQFGKGVADVKYDIFWTPEDFQDETKLPAFFSSEVSVRGRAHSVDPTKVRIGFQGQSHEIEATMKANNLTLTAKGGYRRELGNLIEALNPQVAKLRLSKDDAERLLRHVKRSPAGKYLAPSLERALQPEEKMTLSLGLGGGIGFGSQEIIEIALRTKHLDGVREAIGKPLLNGSGKDETGVTELIRLYHAVDLLRGRRLSDLQYLARAIPEMDLGIVYGSPVITLGQAKELLESEIELMTKGYESIFGLGMNSHMWRGGVVKRLAREHFGEEVVDKFEGLGVWDYVDFLKSHGYFEPRAEDVESESTREIYAKSRAEGKTPDRAFANEPEYIAKERHLLEFFKQSYAEDPRESVERFREAYTNSEPRLEVSATARHLDASKLRKLKLPPKSRLISFGITEHMNRATPYSNDLTISRTLPSSDDVHFWSRTSVDKPMLLGLQEYACREMGVQFK